MRGVITIERRRSYASNMRAEASEEREKKKAVRKLSRHRRGCDRSWLLEDLRREFDHPQLENLLEKTAAVIHN